MSETVYRIRTNKPLLWRTPSSLQVGVDEPVTVVDDIPDNAARLVHALHDGISAHGFDSLRRQLKLPASTATALLEALHPTFQSPPEQHRTSIAVLSRSRAGAALATQLAHLGAAVTLESQPQPALEQGVDLVVLAADYLLDPAWRVSLSATHTPHLPVVFSDSSIQVGPLVRIGDTPCLVCLELAHRDREPHWLSLGSQLWSLESPLGSAVGGSIAGLLAALLTGLATASPDWWGAESATALVWHAESNHIVARPHDFHPECLCRGL